MYLAFGCAAVMTYGWYHLVVGIRERKCVPSPHPNPTRPPSHITSLPEQFHPQC